MLIAANDNLDPHAPRRLELLTLGFVVITTLAIALIGF
jgi:hypothetical protein